MVKAFNLLVPFILAFLGKSASARSWKQIGLLHDMNVLDHIGSAYLEVTEKILLKAASRPGGSNAPVVSPAVLTRVPTTNAPSPMPSGAPTLTPSDVPSSIPSEVPTSMPYVDPFPPGIEPNDASNWYFNYDKVSNYGPQHWGNVGSPPKDFWEEFDDPGYGAWASILEERDPTKNVCANGELQSPIDLWESGGNCLEGNEVRELPGDFNLTGDFVNKSFESNKLRLQYFRRPCLDLEQVLCGEPDPPHADFPNGWGGYGEVIHIDIKSPSEHTVRGERFDAEMQIFHIHPERKRLVTQSVLVTAKEDGYNYYFQEALKAFQKEYHVDKNECRKQLQGDGNMTRASDQNGTDWLGLDDPVDASIGRDLQFNASDAWNPYHAMLIPSIQFWRYDGSLTEPPCGEFVSWFVADKPMIISFEQLQQLRGLMFTYVSSNCDRPSVQFDHSVARPIQNSNGRNVTLCSAINFGPDP